MSTETKKRILALDVGDARIGVAISDPLGLTAQPLKTIERGGRNVLTQVVEIVQEQGVGRVVVGMPYELSGAIGEQAKKVESFVQKLERELLKKPELQGVTVAIWDERLSSVEAEKIIAGSRLKDNARHAALDRVSAAIILDSYLRCLP